MFIKPANELKIRDPKTQCLIPPEGMEVEPSLFWQRRLNSGEVVLVKNRILATPKSAEKNSISRKEVDKT